VQSSKQLCSTCQHCQSAIVDAPVEADKAHLSASQSAASLGSMLQHDSQAKRPKPYAICSGVILSCFAYLAWYNNSASPLLRASEKSNA